MSGRERRISPRKKCALSLRYRVVANGRNPQTEQSAAGEGSRTVKIPASSASLEGEALNLSERGLYFTSREKLSIGAPLEIYLTLPRELTGRSPEPVRCSARVVHVEERAGELGVKGIGAAVERFEPLAAARDWSN
jgi:hypothetical protein